MLGKDEIAAAARKADAIAERGDTGLPGWCQQYDIDVEGLVYVAQQRGLRAAMIVIDKKDPTQLPRDRQVPVRLSPLAERLLPAFASACLDGFAIGMTAERER